MTAPARRITAKTIATMLTIFQVECRMFSCLHGFVFKFFEIPNIQELNDDFRHEYGKSKTYKLIISILLLSAP